MRFSRLAEHLPEPQITRMMKDAREIKGLLSLAAGFSDTRVLPASLLNQAWSSLHSSHPIPDYLQYGTNSGRPGLRQQILQQLRTHPDETLPGIDLEQTAITNGSQQALYLAAQTLCNPGDKILVEAPSYFVFLEALKGLGIEAVSIPEHPNGELDQQQLRSLLTEDATNGSRIRGLYLISWYANPSSRCRSLQYKQDIAQVLTSEHPHLPIIEDAAYRDLWFEQPWPVPSILSLPEFSPFPRLYLGSFSKSLVSGLKTGFMICTHPEWMTRLLGYKGHHDFGTSHLNQALIEEAFKLPEMGAYSEQIRTHYRYKRDTLEQSLIEGKLRDLGWTWDSPQGGLLMWLRAPEGISTNPGSPFYQHCLQDKVLYVPGNLCFAGDAPSNFVRLSYGFLPEEELEEAGKRFCHAAHSAD